MGRSGLEMGVGVVGRGVSATIEPSIGIQPRLHRQFREALVAAGLLGDGG